MTSRDEYVGGRRAAGFARDRERANRRKIEALNEERAVDLDAEVARWERILHDAEARGMQGLADVARRRLGELLEEEGEL